MVLKPLPEVKLLYCNAIIGEEFLSQHRFVRTDFQFSDCPKKKWKGTKTLLKLWRLKDSQLRERFESELSTSMSSFEGTWTEVENKLLTTCERICGRISGKRGEEREKWWWNTL